MLGGLLAWSCASQGCFLRLGHSGERRPLVESLSVPLAVARLQLLPRLRVHEDGLGEHFLVVQDLQAVLDSLDVVVI